MPLVVGIQTAVLLILDFNVKFGKAVSQSVTSVAIINAVFVCQNAAST